jgi:hypothetical protein
MEDELDRLRNSTALRSLLEHYAAALAPEAWQDRLMQQQGLSPRELVVLHGELIAQQWLEQNTGVVAAVRPGTVAGCYRATRAGRRALVAAARPRDDDECAVSAEITAASAASQR